MKKHWFTVGVVLAAAVTFLSGVIQGRMRDRWGMSAAMKAAADRLKDIPAHAGQWRLKAEQEMSETTVNMLECKGYVDRTYVHQQSGAAITMFIVVGPAGPIAVHTPEVCMASGYEQLEERKHVALGASADSTAFADSGDEFWTVDFRSKDLWKSQVRVYYAWGTGGTWSAPKDARYKFAGQPYLYKIQLQSNVPPAADLSKSDPCRDFLRDFVPVAREFLIDSSGKWEDYPTE